jgi:hypothetical protein
MRFDAKLAFSTDQNITANDTTADSETTLDSGFADPNLGKNGRLGVMVVIKASEGTATSLDVAVWHGAAANNEEELVAKTILLARLVKSNQFFIPYPKDVMRYRKLIYTVVGTSNDALIVDAYETTEQ